MKNNIRLDCLCHRLHTVLESAWRDTKRDEQDAATYETSISDVCRFAKQSTGVQEQLPRSLKHGGDTRPWVSMFRHADSVEASYDALVKVLTERNRLSLIANVNRSLNREIMEITRSMKEVFESLESSNEPTLHLVVPSYYLMQRKLKPVARESKVMLTFRQHLLTYLDNKFWTSIKALHWMTTFLEPTFKSFEFIPQVTMEDIRFK